MAHTVSFRHHPPARVTVTYWQAQLVVYTPAPGGGDYVHPFSCTHHHTSITAADRCQASMARLATRYGTQLADHVKWVTA